MLRVNGNKTGTFCFTATAARNVVLFQRCMKKNWNDALPSTKAIKISFILASVFWGSFFGLVLTWKVPKAPSSLLLGWTTQLLLEYLNSHSQNLAKIPQKKFTHNTQMQFLGTGDLAIPLVSEAGSRRAQEAGTAKRTSPSGPCQPQERKEMSPQIHWRLLLQLCCEQEMV